MPRTRITFTKSVKRFFARRFAASARQYLTSDLKAHDSLALIRAMAESAKDLMSDQVFNETIRAMNEQTVAEIAEGGLLDDRERTVLYLKLQVISDFQQALVGHVQNYETMATIREAERRQQINEEATYG